MAFVFGDGFDGYATAQLTSKWTNVGQGSGATIAVASPGYLGTGNYALLSGTANAATLTKALVGAPYATLVVGFRFQWNATALANLFIWTFQDNLGALLGNLGVTTSGQLFYQNAAGSSVAVSPVGVLSAEKWTYIECSVTFSNSTSGAVTLKVNQVQVAAVASVNTSGTNANTCSLAGPFNSNCGITGMAYDDIYMVSTTGSAPTTFGGAVNALTTVVSGNGRVNQFTAVGAGANWQCVSQYPPDDDATYVESSTASQEDCYTYTALAGIQSVFAVQSVAYARDDNSPSRVLSAGFGNGTSESFDGGQALNQTYTCVLRPMGINPITSTGWTVSDINSTGQVAVELVS